MNVAAVKTALAARGVTRASTSAFIRAHPRKIAAGVGALTVGGLYANRPDYDPNYSSTTEAAMLDDIETSYLSDDKYDAAVRRRFKYFRGALDEYGSPVGTGHNRIVMPKSLLSQDDIEDVLGFVPVEIAIPEAGQIRNTSYRHPDMNYHIHDHRGAWVMHEDSHAASTMLIKKYHIEHEAAVEAGHDVPEKSWIEPIKLFVKGIPHVITEGIPGAYYYIKGQVIGAESMLSRLEKETPAEYVSELEEMKQLKRGHPINGFDGLPHGGMGQEMRKEMTSFGSKFDPLKALSRQLGAQLEGKLAAGTVVKELGRGGFGTAHLMETTIEGAKYQYVRKTMHGHIGRRRSSATPEEARMLDLTHEAEMMRPLRHTETVPSVYSATPDVMFMEAMPGETLHAIAARGEAFPTSKITEALKSTAHEAQQLGIANIDVHGKNIMVDKASGRVSWVDWGTALKSGMAPGQVGGPAGMLDPVQKAGIAELGEDIQAQLRSFADVRPYRMKKRAAQVAGQIEEQSRQIASSRKKAAEELTEAPMRRRMAVAKAQGRAKAARKKQMMEEALVDTQRAVASAAIHGGKGHVAFRSTMRPITGRESTVLGGKR